MRTEENPHGVAKIVLEKSLELLGQRKVADSRKSTSLQTVSDLIIEAYRQYNTDELESCFSYSYFASYPKKEA